jgi:hypothetical protein
MCVAKRQAKAPQAIDSERGTMVPSTGSQRFPPCGLSTGPPSPHRAIGGRSLTGIEQRFLCISKTFSHSSAKFPPPLLPPQR